MNQKCPTTNDSADATKPYTERRIYTFFSPIFLISNGQIAILIIEPTAVTIPSTATRFCEPSMVFAACTCIPIDICLPNPRKYDTITSISGLLSLRALNISLAVVFSPDTYGTRSLFKSGISANNAQPKTAVRIAVQRYSEAIIGISVSPDLTNTFDPPGIMRQAIGTITTQAEKPICLNVFDIDTTFVRSVGLGVKTEAIP